MHFCDINIICTCIAFYRCIDRSAGYLSMCPQRCCRIIQATAILHNMCVAARLPDIEAAYIEDELEQEVARDNDQGGMATRMNLIRSRFA